MSILENLFDFGINLLRGAIGSFGELEFEVHVSRFNSTLKALGQAGSKLIHDEATSNLVGKLSSDKVMTFTNFQRRTRARYAHHELINAKTVLEKIGDEPDQITLDIKLIRSFINPEEQAELIRTYITEGHQDFLIIGSEVMGQFVITEVSEQKDYVDCFGRTLVSVLQVTFEEIAE